MSGEKEGRAGGGSSRVACPLTEMNDAPDSLATALASSVLPQPGGPKRRTPHDGERPEGVEERRVSQQRARSKQASGTPSSQQAQRRVGSSHVSGR